MTERRELDAHLELMDRQILDNEGLMVAKVDDVELTERDDGRIYVTALLTGPAVWGPRLRGALGSVAEAAWSRLSGKTEPTRIEWGVVAEVATAITLAVGRRSQHADGFEVWMSDRVIAAIPGSEVEGG